MEIKIEVDVDKKTAMFTKVPEILERDPVVFMSIMHGLTGSILRGIHLEPVSPIVKPKMKVFNGASKVIGGK